MSDGSSNPAEAKVLNYGMVGGGPGAFIGDVHRKAAAFDAKSRLVAGVFSSTLERTKQAGRELGLDEERLYGSYEEMAKKEAQRRDGIDFVSIVTPNHLHYPVAKAFLENGIHVVCDKPLATTSRDAEELSKLAHDNGLLFCVTYTYTGYPIVKHARALVQNGDIGEIRFVMAEYPQDWLAVRLEAGGQKQASWRTDPKQTGASNCVGDIGTHIENLVAYITGLKITRLAARLDTYVEGRELDDNASIMVDYETGAKGIYWSSQIAIGFDNALRVRVFGDKGGIEFAQEDPNHLKVAYIDSAAQIVSRGRDALDAHAGNYSRVPAGHPEGFFEAFSNIYATFASALSAVKAGKKPTKEQLDFPSVDDGLQGVRFVERCVESSKNGAAWVGF